METTFFDLGCKGLGVLAPIMENQMEKHMKIAWKFCF